MTREVEAFFRRLAAAPRAVLGLDYDGTLAPFHRRPAEAVPHRHLRGILRRIMEEGRTRVVVISGRPADDVRRLLGPGTTSEIWGAHGWEHLRPGCPAAPLPVDGRILSTLARARDALAVGGLLGRAEWKTASVAVHWRGESDAPAIAAAARAALAPLADAPAFELLEFAAGVELRCRQRHKGTALAAVLAAEAPGVPAAYLGDDQTDEDAFTVLASRGLAVLVAEAPRPSAAATNVAPGDGVRDFLTRWLATTATTPESRGIASIGGAP